jgi:hypothetical protein
MPVRSTLLLCLLACPFAALSQAPAAPSSVQSSACAAAPAPPVTDADRAFAAGDFSKAESLYAATIPATATSYAGLVRTQIEQDKLSEALASAQKAAAALPSAGDAQALPGLALIRAGQISEASAAISKAYALDRCAPLTIFALAQLNDLVSRHLTAARQYAAARTLAPSNPFLTAAWILSLPAGPTPTDDSRTPTLRAFLGTNPLLPPATLDSLKTSLALLEQHATCTPADPRAPATLTIEGLMLYGTHVRGWGLKARVNTADLPLLELDSSVSGIVLNPGDAKKAGVHPIGAATPNAIYTAIADHVKIGPVEYQNCPVRVAPAAALANSNSLIGTDFFRDRLIRIDYVQRQVALTPYPEPPTGLSDRAVAPNQKDWSPVYMAGSNILLPTLVNKKGPAMFLLDTGAFVSILSPTLNSQVLLSMHDKDSNIHGSSGVIVKTIPKYGGSEMEVNNPEVLGPNGKFLHVSAPIKIPTLRFANTEFNDDEALSFDITPKSHDTGVEIGGLLGFSTLREFYIDLDYRNGLVRLTYDPKHLYITREYDRTKRPD